MPNEQLLLERLAVLPAKYSLLIGGFAGTRQPLRAFIFMNASIPSMRHLFCGG